ncbi:MAG TPA: CpaF family protein [Candidatus Dormibacteraeota bacterium]
MALTERLAARRALLGGDNESPAAVPALRMVPERPATEPAAQSPLRITAEADLSAARAEIHSLLVDQHANDLDISDREGVRQKVSAVTEDYVRRRALKVSQRELRILVDGVFDEVCGLGPLQPLIDDPEISEIMINHPRQVFIERHGRLIRSEITFEGDRQLKQIIDRIVASIGRRVDESSPMCDARLRDGSRVNVVIPPLALEGPCMTIRKFSREKLGPGDLMRLGAASEQMLDYLGAAVRTKLNVLVSGGTSSGKTTLLNVLSGFIPDQERVITVEDAAELQLRQAHVIRMESRPPNVEGVGAVEIRDLVRNALRMRPDRIIVGECRGGEALDMLQAMNTGHEGSMSTVHANNPADAISRLETMVLMAGTDLPSRAIIKQIAAAVDVIVQTQRVRGGARKIVRISEVCGLNDGEVELRDLFEYRQTGVDDEDRAVGHHTATGIPSHRMEHFRARGANLTEALFVPTGGA